jgi:fibronectin-binding autotransporter adhesin
MLRTPRLPLGLLALILVCTGLRPAQAELVPDGGSAVIEGVTTNGGIVYVGNDRSFTSLLVTNASVTNVIEFWIGHHAASRSNSVVLTGAATTWLSPSATIVGNSGAFNRLEIRDGAYLTNREARIGLIGGTNIAIVSGTNSLWDMQWRVSTSHGRMTVGMFGGGNTLLITNGGKVADGFAYIGWDSGANGNQVIVTDPGSLWSHTNTTWYVGYDGGGNSLIITNGGTVTGGRCDVGFQGRSNRVVVTGTNSRLACSAINLISDNNELGIRAGARLTNGLTCGQYGNSNLVCVTDPGSLWSNAGDLNVGWDGRGNQLIISNGAVVTANITYVAANSGSQQRIILTGPGSLLTNSVSFLLGYIGSSNQLLIADGAQLSDNNGSLGFTTSQRHVVTVTDPNSVWTNRTSLIIRGGHSQLVISNGGCVFAGNSDFGGGSNSVIVTGTGSLWSNRTDLQFQGSSNQLIVTAGGTVKSPILTMSFGSGSINNLLLVAGGNVVLTNSGQGVLTVRGLAILNSGLVQVNRLQVNLSGLEQFLFNGGTLVAQEAAINKSGAFQIGDGTNAATYYQPTTGTHSFTSGLIVSSNALLAGAGTIPSAVTVQPGGTIAPGTSNLLFQTLTASLVLSNGSIARFQLNAQDGTTTHIKGNPAVTLGGTLQLTNVQGTLAAGMAFQLFQSTNVQGTFSTIEPASPGPGLRWHTNGLAIDGTLRVVSLIPPPPLIQSALVVPSGLWLQATAGTPYDPVYLLTSTNLNDWETIATNSFDPFGNLSLTNPIISTEATRFFRLQLAP